MVKRLQLKASHWICLGGVIAMLAMYAYWIISDKHVNKAGYVAATLGLALFVGICLRFVPCWMDFWSKGSCSVQSGMRIASSEILKIFVQILTVDFVVIALACLFRFLMGQAPTVWDGILFWNYLDTGNYLEIAENWYVPVGEAGARRLVFFPGYPLAIRALNILVGNSMISALIVSALCHASSAVLLYGLLLLDYTEECARRTVRYLAILPAAFFFSAPMSESLFMLLSISSYYCARRGKWLAAGIFGALCSFTRSMGVLVFAALFLELVAAWRAEGGSCRKWVLRMLALFMTPMGLVAYLLINLSVTGNAFTFMTLQKEYWQQGFGLFFDMLAFQVDNGLAMVDTPDYHAALGVWFPNVAYSFAVLLLMFVFAKKLRPSYTAWFVAYFFIAMGAKFLISGPRYLVALVPIYPALAEMSKNKKLNTAFSIACLPLAIYYLWACTMLWDVF